MNGDRETTADDGAQRAAPNRRGWLWAALAVIVVGAVVGIAVAVNSGTDDTAQPAASTPTTTPAPDSATPDAATPQAATPDATPGDGADGAAPDRGPAEPVAFDETAVVTDGVTASVTGIESVTGEAKLPGEISGPALRVTAEIANDTDAAIDLTTTVVTVYYGDDLLQASPVSLPEGSPFPRSVAPGEKASGTFVFEVPEDQRGRVRVEVDLVVTEPIVAFEGSLS
ncbi:DUF4352 domain-containing protein [Microbacterium sp. zg.Y1090]|uniref:DUF4352 domain-containing protein n=1 Tax=Microbacterium TaxID=33882 RepID=UPI00214B5402|nr:MULTISPECIES: DUF4352 domain-containing protein [unclassified Microbacterium]MCR2814206.1 DUF4352 domain-containing protein [Microbacterium sp. zg.Y1084]MCR2820022.1 DUF4352 domain-containing protein [Microbacterium sp. zg.Y1090]MDL5488222.1 DUF4352 domain-containing protein [Microbacterium sp. zg-Y1211]WIM27963.1 DUF4352 domain-containing protein [Microbacterium sp. zg-Y1090]